MPIKILVVDDEPIITKMLQARLTASGYETRIAADGVDALETVEGEKPDLIILDVMMPRMTGYEFLKALRAKGGDFEKIPVLVMSAKESMKDFFDRWEIIGFIPKPFDAEVLLQKIQDVLGASAMGMPKPDAPPLAAEAAPGKTVPPPASPKPQIAPSATPVAQASKKVPNKVMLLGVEDYVVDKLKDLFQSRGITVVVEAEVEEAVKAAGVTKPDLVLCQFWEEKTRLDAEFLYLKMQESPSLRDIAFCTYCKNAFKEEVAKHFKKSEMVAYSDMDDLSKKIKNLFLPSK